MSLASPALMALLPPMASYLGRMHFTRGDGDGPPAGAVVVLRDVTERRATEEALRQPGHERLRCQQAALGGAGALRVGVALRGAHAVAGEEERDQAAQARAAPATRGSRRSRLPNTVPSLAYGNGPPEWIAR